jgi:predicted nucleic acid-binding protein
MILVDTSVWIEFLAGRARKPGPVELVQFATCGPVLQSPMFVGPAFVLDLSRGGRALPRGRAEGLTIRSAMDCLIAAIAIENRVPVWHHDRDFAAIARYSRLVAFQDASPSLASRSRVRA